MKFTYAQLDDVGLQLNELENAVTGIRSELHPLYPDNLMTSGDLPTLKAQLERTAEVLAELRALVDRLDPAESHEVAFYDTTTELHDDLGTFDPSPRD